MGITADDIRKSSSGNPPYDPLRWYEHVDSFGRPLDNPCVTNYCTYKAEEGSKYCIECGKNKALENDLKIEADKANTYRLTKLYELGDSKFRHNSWQINISREGSISCTYVGPIEVNHSYKESAMDEGFDMDQYNPNITTVNGKEKVVEHKIINGVRYMFSSEEARMEIHLINRELTEKIMVFLELFKDHLQHNKCYIAYSTYSEKEVIFLKAEEVLNVLISGHPKAEIHNILVYLLEIDVNGS